MKKTNSTKKALIASLLSLCLCFTMLIGTTFAWFTDSVTSKGNKIVSGNLDVDLMYWTDTTTSVEITENEEPIFGGADSLIAQNNNLNTLWEPGKTQVAYLSIKNNGSLDLKYKVALEVYGIEKNLDEVMVYSITNDAKYGEVTSWNPANAVAVVPGTNNTQAEDVALKHGEEHFFALSIHMLETAGNDYQNGQISFDIKVLATQLASESDSFDGTYDEDSKYDFYASGSAPIIDGQVNAGLDENGNIKGWIDMIDYNTNAQVGSVTIKPASLAEGATSVEATYMATENDPNFVIDDGYSAERFEINVSGIKEGNTEPILVQMNIGTDYDMDLTVYHGIKDAYGNLTYVELDEADVRYNPYTGVLIFETLSFSPFVIVYKPGYTAELPEGMPVADLKDVTAEHTTIEWNEVAGSENQTLDVVYEFKAPEAFDTAEEAGDYWNWNCDFVVSVDRDSKEGELFLGGNYGSFYWVGFDNPIDVKAGEEVYLISSQFDPWTYQMIAEQVGTFLCGVAISDNAENPEALVGATFTVKLRLWNPTDVDEKYDVNVVTYTFTAEDAVKTPVNN